MHARIRRFVAEYLIDLNAAAAARRAGYPPGSAAYRGNKLVARKDVRDLIRAEIEARAERTRVSADRVLREYARIAFADLRNVSDWDADGVRLRPPAELSPDDTAAIAWVSVGGRKGTHAQRIRLHDKQRALAALARHLGLFDLRRFAGDPERALAARQEAAARTRALLAARLKDLGGAE